MNSPDPEAAFFPDSPNPSPLDNAAADAPGAQAGPKDADPKAAEPEVADPKAAESEDADPKAAEPKLFDDFEHPTILTQARSRRPQPIHKLLVSTSLKPSRFPSSQLRTRKLWTPNTPFNGARPSKMNLKLFADARSTRSSTFLQMARQSDIAGVSR